MFSRESPKILVSEYKKNTEVCVYQTNKFSKHTPISFPGMASEQTSLTFQVLRPYPTLATYISESTIVYHKKIQPPPIFKHKKTPKTYLPLNFILFLLPLRKLCFHLLPYPMPLAKDIKNELN